MEIFDESTQQWVDDSNIAMPAEGGAVSNSPDAPWYAAPLAYTLKAVIDSEFARPLTFQDSTRYGYAVAPNGQVYVRGQPVPGISNAPGAPGAQLLSGSTTTLLVMAAIVIAALTLIK